MLPCAASRREYASARTPYLPVEKRVKQIIVIALFASGCGGGNTPNPTSPTPQPSSSPIELRVSFDPPSVVGGNTTQGTLTLSGAVPSVTTVMLSSDNAAVATVPETVTIPGGTTTVNFTVTTLQVQTPTSVMIRATTGSSGVSGSAQMSVGQIPTCGPFLTAQVAMPFYVYADDGDPRTHFIPSGFFGDVADLTLSVGDASSPQSGRTAIRIDYRPRGPQRFAGIFFQCGTFGDTRDVGFNLGLARQVQFWARSSVAGVRAEFKAGGIMGPFPDTLPSVSTNPAIVTLDTTWRQFTIDVAGRNLTRVIGGFMFVTSTAQNSNGATVFLDEIVWR